MRNFSLREKQSIITVLREPPKKVNKVPWQKWSFIAFLVLLISIIAYRAFASLWTIQANGQIEVKKQTVHFAQDIKLTHFFVEEGEKVQKGDTLFRYTPIVDEFVSTSITDYDRPQDWIEKQKLDLSSKIAVKRFEIEELGGRIIDVTELAELKKKMVLLGSVNDKNPYEQLRLQIEQLRLQQQSAKKEKEYLQKLLYSLKKKDTAGSRVTTTNKTVKDSRSFFVSTMDGVIGQINFNPEETCFRREEVLTIHELKDMKIKVYFDPVEMKYLQAGDEVNITFPDGSQSIGKIENFHVATYALPDEFQKKYEPTTRNIVANVTVVDEYDKYKLMNFYKMNVRISKSRFKLFS
jgi:multidrug resistance efflux pump